MAKWPASDSFEAALAAIALDAAMSAGLRVAATLRQPTPGVPPEFRTVVEKLDESSEI